MTPYYQSPHATLYLGDCREVLRELPADSVHCVVTSPPYFGGIRDYKIPPLVWGGDEGCEHEWGVNEGRKLSKPDSGLNSSGSGNPRQGVDVDVSLGRFCIHCPAWRGSLGLEPTPALYVAHLVEIFREVRRVLRPDGVTFLNLGDTYVGGGRGQAEHAGAKQRTSEGTLHSEPLRDVPGLKPLDLAGIPWAVAMALRDDGWYLRADVIWSKPSPMPESVNGWRWEQCKAKIKGNSNSDHGKNAHSENRTAVGFNDRWDGVEDASATYTDCPDCPKCEPNGGLVLRRGNWRPTSSHEYVFMLAKGVPYFCDADAVREGDQVFTQKAGGYKNHSSQQDGHEPFRGEGGFADTTVTTVGRNPRSVWTINTEPTKLPHYATFPSKLVERCVLAATSEGGVCSECGAQRAPVVEKDESLAEARRGTSGYESRGAEAGRRFGSATPGYTTRTQVKGFRATCDCGAPSEPAVVLDPFGGLMTTVRVAQRLGRRGIGVDMSEEYLDLAVNELGKVPMPMPFG